MILFNISACGRKVKRIPEGSCQARSQRFEEVGARVAMYLE